MEDSTSYHKKFKTFQRQTTHFENQVGKKIVTLILVNGLTTDIQIEMPRQF